MSTSADRPDVPAVRVSDTGPASAGAGGTAVSGYRGPVPEGTAPPVRVARTSAAHANAPYSVANTGHLTIHQQRTPRRPAAWPHQVGVIPPRARSFQQRAEADRLRAAVRGGGGGGPCLVLTGMGGVGKTQLAAEHARTAWSDGSVDVLVWVTAATRTAVVTGYANAGVELCGADPDDPERAAAAFLAWLQPKSGAAPCRWLVVLDDAADPDDLRGLWPPASPTGRVLVTTRRRDAALTTGDGRRPVEVGLFTAAEAVGYLTEMLAAHGRTEPEEQLALLSGDLGNLPLALSQAAAYLVDAAVTAADYRLLLADRSTALADAAPDALPDDQDHTVAAALTLSLDRADTLRPRGLARPLLRLAAVLAPNGIPHTVLTGPAARIHLGGEHLTEAQATAALRTLHKLHLLEHTPGTPHQAVRVHQLTQRAVRDALPADRLGSLALAAADALAEAWPDIDRDTELTQALRANTTALTACAEDHLYEPDVHLVLFCAGHSLGRSGRAAAARDHFQRLADRARHRLGPDHLDLLAVRHDFAHWQGEAGDPAGAAASYTALLADAVRVFGRDHPNTLAVRSNRMRWQGMAGDSAGAAAAYTELLADAVRILGPDHPNTLAVRGNLAWWQGISASPADAVTTCAELVTDAVRLLGPDHPDTLTVRGNLAWLRGKAGDPAGATAAYTELLADAVRVLGPTHPDTLALRNGRAGWQGEAGDPAGAAAACFDLLVDAVQVFGTDHPTILAMLENLMRWRKRAGLRGRPQHLGPTGVDGG